MSEKVLIYRLGSLGDTIVALPCFNAIRVAHVADTKILLTNVPVSTKAAPLASILGIGTGFFDEVLAYPVGLRNPIELLRLLMAIRRLKIEAVIYLSPSRGRLRAVRDWLFFRLAGVRRIYGLPFGYGRAECLRLPDGTIEPEAVRLARCLGDQYRVDLTALSSWDLCLTEAEQDVGKRAVSALSGRPFVALNTGGKAVEKDWGLANWELLVRRLAARFPSFGLLIVGAAEDATRAEQLLALWPSHVVNACGALTPRETAVAVQGAAFFIGHDSGPLHLAASVGVPCLGLFGNFNEPKKWHPYGSKHRVLHEMRGLAYLTVDAVERAVQEVSNEL